MLKTLGDRMRADFIEMIFKLIFRGTVKGEGER